tara:strand:- start:125 stop:235 length:111 start_codon:yes stop_codon:yes gene_type:complete
MIGPDMRRPHSSDAKLETGTSIEDVQMGEEFRKVVK